jgi:hypothetical protein
MLDSIKLAIHCPYLKDESGNYHRPFNRMFYDIMLKNVKQNNSGFILNSTTGIYTRSKDTVFSGQSTIYDTYESLILNGQIKVPSHEYNMHFRVFEERVEIEFSIPKFLYGTNVLQLLQHVKRKAEPYEMLVLSLKKVFSEIFFNVPIHWGAVELLRWDVCFNQVFPSREISLKALKYIKLKHQSKGDRLNYEYGLVQLTKSNYLKIYHKGEEFHKHDIYKYNGLYLRELSAISNRVLRYEKKYTRKNISYAYNMHFKYREHPDRKKYLEQKKKGVVSKYLRKEFESVQRFTLGNSVINGCTLLPEHFFNWTFYHFKDEIQKKFTIGKMSVDHLHHAVIDNAKDKAAKVKILTFIKTFGSLKRAYERGAFSKATYYRYCKDLDEKGLSQTKVPTMIGQDWSNLAYYRALFNKGVAVTNIIKSMDF